MRLKTGGGDQILQNCSMLTKLSLNNYVLKKENTKIGKGLLLFVEDGCWWPLLLEILKKHLYVIRSLSCGGKFTIQKYEARYHTANSVTNYLNENVPDNIRKQNCSPYFCDLNLLDNYLGHFH